MPVTRGGCAGRTARSTIERLRFAPLVWLGLAFAALVAGPSGVAFGQAAASGPVEYGAIVFPGEETTRSGTQIAVLPFRLNSESSLGFLTDSLDELLAQRIEAGGEVGAVATRNLQGPDARALDGGDRSDTALRRRAVAP